jgi:hypothetical protein
MKKFLIGIAVGGMMLTSVSVEAAQNQKNHRNNDWVAPLVIGSMIGIIMNNAANQNVHHERRRGFRHHPRYRRYLPIDRPRFERPRYYPRYIKKCITVGSYWTEYGYRPRIACHFVPSERRRYLEETSPHRN